MLAEILGAAANVGSTMLQAKYDRENTDRQNQANLKLADFSFTKDLEMWNRGNEYNAPKAQMSRLNAAGLNPNMVYGSGSATGNTSSALPKYQAPQLRYNYTPPVNPMGILNSYMDLQMKQAQIDNVKANALYNQFTLDNRINMLGYKRYMAEGDYKVKYGFNGGTSFGEGSIGYDLANYKRQSLKAGLGKTQADILNTNASTQRTYQTLGLLEQQIAKAKKENNWYTANALSGILSKVVGAFGLSSIGSNLTKKPVTINKTPTYINNQPLFQKSRK